MLCREVLAGSHLTGARGKVLPCKRCLAAVLLSMLPEGLESDVVQRSCVSHVCQSHLRSRRPTGTWQSGTVTWQPAGSGLSALWWAPAPAPAGAWACLLQRLTALVTSTGGPATSERGVKQSKISEDCCPQRRRHQSSRAHAGRFSGRGAGLITAMENATSQA